MLLLSPLLRDADDVFAAAEGNRELRELDLALLPAVRRPLLRDQLLLETPWEEGDDRLGHEGQSQLGRDGAHRVVAVVHPEHALERGEVALFELGRALLQVPHSDERTLRVYHRDNGPEGIELLQVVPGVLGAKHDLPPLHPVPRLRPPPAADFARLVADPVAVDISVAGLRIALSADAGALHRSEQVLDRLAESRPITAAGELLADRLAQRVVLRRGPRGLDGDVFLWNDAVGPSGVDRVNWPGFVAGLRCGPGNEPA